MPLIKHLSSEIEKLVTPALHEMGLRSPSEEANDDVPSLLSQNGLGVREVIEGMAQIAQNSTSEALRMRALENAAKMHGAMKPPEAGASVNMKLVIYAPQMRSESEFRSVEV
jgi:hypothetical protein